MRHPDDTQEEMAKEFGCCNQAISKVLKRNGITRKKRHYTIKNKIRLIFLPYYSPELNPIEKFWFVLKHRIKINIRSCSSLIMLFL